MKLISRFVALALLASGSLHSGITAYAQEAVTENEAVQMEKPATRPVPSKLKRESLAERMKARAQKYAKEKAVQVNKIQSPGKIVFHAHSEKNQHKGEFEKWRFTKVDIPEGDLSRGTVELEIEMASVKTDDQKLTTQLRTPDCLDVGKYPKATVTITDVNPVAHEDIPHEELGAGKAEEAQAGKMAEQQHYVGNALVDLHGVKKPAKIYFVVLNEDPFVVKGRSIIDLSEHGIGKDNYSEANSTITEKIPIQFEATVMTEEELAEQASKAKIRKAVPKPSSKPAKK